MLVVGNCCYVAVCSAAQGTLAPTGEERGGIYIVAATHLQLVYLLDVGLGYVTIQPSLCPN